MVAACISRVNETALAESIGEQFAVKMEQPLQEAAEGRGTEAVVMALSAAMEDGVAELALPPEVDAVQRGDSASCTSDGFAYVATNISVLLTDGPGFCVIVAVDSEGRVVAEPALGPLPDCWHADLPDFTP